MLQKITLLIVFIALIESSFNAKPMARVILLVNTHNDYNHQYASKFSITPTADHSSVNFDLIIVQNITDTIWFKVMADMKLPKMPEYRTIFNYEADGCDILGKSMSGKKTIVNNWLKSFINDSNLPQSCPLLVGTYKWHNFRLAPKGVPLIAMDGLYRLNLILYLKRNNLMEVLANTTVNTVVKVK